MSMSEAKWKLLVDWNGNGQFAGVNDDITRATLELSLRHMRDLKTEYIDAAQLDIRLANSDHKYSPPNSASPLFGSLKPGRKIWLRAAFPCDEFRGAPGASLAGRAPDFGGAYRWSDAKRSFRIGGGGAQTNGAQLGRRIATMDFGLADVSFGCVFTRGSDATRHGGLTLRYSGDDNFLYIRLAASGIQVRKVERGRDTQIARAALKWKSGEARFVQAELHGDLIRVFVDSQQVIAARSAFNAAATRHGLYCDGRADHLWQQFGGWASLFYGDLHSISPQPGTAQCRIRAYDEMRRLEDVTLYMYATSAFPQTSGEILSDMLSYAGVNSERKMLDAGAELVPQRWSPSLWGVQAADEIRRLQDEEDGLVFVDGYGYWRLENRGHRGGAPHTTAKALLRSGGSAGAYFSELEWSDGVNNVQNKLFMRIRDATNHGHRTVWALIETPYFNAGETREFLAESKDFDVVGGQLPPRPNTDYTANTRADGTGADITSQVSVTYPSIRLYNGRGTLMRVRFGRAAGYLTRLGMRTVNARTYNAPLLLTVEDRSSQRDYGQRIHAIDARWIREAQRAQAALDSRLARRALPRTALKVTLPNGSDVNALTMLQLRLSDRVALRYKDMGVDGDFFVEGHSLEVASGGKKITRTLLLRAAGK